MSEVCKIADCGKKTKGYGYCIMHYHKLKRYGDPLGGKTYRQRGTGNLSHGYKRNGQELEHIQIAEKALGKPLPVGAVVHHTDEAQGTINPYGIVICQDQAYHMLLHQRSRALRACGHADWRKCHICKQYDTPINLKIGDNHAPYHRSCQRLYDQRRKANG